MIEKELELSGSDVTYASVPAFFLEAMRKTIKSGYSVSGRNSK
jgi:hypothetical protein